MQYHYAGIGSRNTPPNVLDWMTQVAERLAVNGFILRSGGAKGADTAFEYGARDKLPLIRGRKEIYTVDSQDVDWPGAFATVEAYHPAPQRLSNYPKSLMARNAFQVLGPQLDDPCSFVLCWTPDGAEQITTMQSGGTGQAIRIAAVNDIPVFNLFNASAPERLYTHVNSIIDQH